MNLNKDTTDEANKLLIIRQILLMGAIGNV